MNEFQKYLDFISVCHKGYKIEELLKDINCREKTNYGISDILKIKSKFENKELVLYFNDDMKIKLNVKITSINNKYLINLMYINTLKNIYNELKSNIDIEINFDEKTEIELNLF